VNAIVLTHAHLDHSGYVPAFVRDGFRGRIYASEGTTELCRILLMDSAHLMGEEARFASAHQWSKHVHPRPLYTHDDVERAMALFAPLPEATSHAIRPDVKVRLVPAGHILGATGARLTVGDRTIHFTGDLGRDDDPLMVAPAMLEPAEIVVTESTYGDRRHSRINPEEALGDIIRRVVKRNGVVLLPAFAVGRTETLLLHLSRLRDRHQIPEVPIFLNSPMALSVLDAYRRHPEAHRVAIDELERMYSLATPVPTVDESKLLNLRGGPMVIISASGMLAGGRILHHLRAYGGDRSNAIVLTGFQAGGTRGAALLHGARSLRMFGEDVPIRAEIVNIDTMSAHADADGILRWLGGVSRPPERVYVVHGEPEAADTLRARINHELKWNARVPDYLERVPV
jgi:metallo-beta-lactamase family protein